MGCAALNIDWSVKERVWRSSPCDGGGLPTSHSRLRFLRLNVVEPVLLSKRSVAGGASLHKDAPFVATGLVCLNPGFVRRRLLEMHRPSGSPVVKATPRLWSNMPKGAKSRSQIVTRPHR